MKKLIISIVFLACFASLPAPGFKELPIAEGKGVKDQALLKAIIQVESGGNPLQVNFKEQAIGLLQIRKIMLKEVNRIVGHEKYTVKDCLDSLKSIEMYWIVQTYHNPSNDVKTGAILWNGKSKRNKYWNKVKKLL